MSNHSLSLSENHQGFYSGNCLQSKIVLITGASSGIGAACAKLFASCGAKLLLCARRDERITKLAQHLKNEYGVEVFSFHLDVTQYAAVKEKINTLPAEWQAVDVVVNNAGLSRGLDKLYEGSVEDWNEMIDTNVKGLLYITRLVLPGMVARKSGHIINIGSVAGHEVYPGGNVYCATKYAVKAISQSLRMDLLGTGIRVSEIDPGAVETEFSLVRFHGDAKRAAAVYKGMQPLTAEDVASTVIYCAACPPHVNISEIRIMPTDQASATMVHREIAH